MHAWLGVCRLVAASNRSVAISTSSSAAAVYPYVDSTCHQLHRIFCRQEQFLQSLPKTVTHYCLLLVKISSLKKAESWVAGWKNGRWPCEHRDGKVTVGPHRDVAVSCCYSEHELLPQSLRPWKLLDYWTCFISWSLDWSRGTEGMVQTLSMHRGQARNTNSKQNIKSSKTIST